LRIEDYFLQIREVIEQCSASLTNVTYDKRGTYEGFIRGEIQFVDGSRLHFREFVDVETEVERLVYAYQYMDASEKLVFRYDSSGHHQKLGIPTYPHHKHQSSESNVVASSAPTLQGVLAEIEQLVKLP
jgi:hypothetical protein